MCGKKDLKLSTFKDLHNLDNDCGSNNIESLNVTLYNPCFPNATVKFKNFPSLIMGSTLNPLVALFPIDFNKNTRSNEDQL